MKIKDLVKKLDNSTKIVVKDFTQKEVLIETNALALKIGTTNELKTIKEMNIDWVGLEIENNKPFMKVVLKK